jgi:hypothetical protein
MSADPLDLAVDAAVGALRRVGRIAERQDAWPLRRETDRLISDLLDAWERAE